MSTSAWASHVTVPDRVQVYDNGERAIDAQHCCGSIVIIVAAVAVTPKQHLVTLTIASNFVLLVTDRSKEWPWDEVNKY